MPRSQVHFTLRLLGFAAYHADVRWSWIIGLQAHVAYLEGDFHEHEAIIRRLAVSAVDAGGVIQETFKPGVEGRLYPWRTWVYHSEGPFTWGAAFCAAAAQL
jgi:hypothetical protein